MLIASLPLIFRSMHKPLTFAFGGISPPSCYCFLASLSNTSLFIFFHSTITTSYNKMAASWQRVDCIYQFPWIKFRFKANFNQFVYNINLYENSGVVMHGKRYDVELSFGSLSRRDRSVSSVSLDILDYRFERIIPRMHSTWFNLMEET